MGMNIMRMKGRAKMMRTIKVTGKGKIAVKPDKIRLYVNKEELCKEYEDTLRRSTEDTELLKDLFEKLGFQRKDLKTVYFNVDTEYESYQDRDKSWKRRFKGYKYNHHMKIEFAADNKRLGQVLYALAHSSLRPEFSIEYTVADVEKCKNELLHKAIEDSIQKAQVLTTAANVKLGEIQAIDYSWGEIDFVTKPLNEMRLMECTECEMSAPGAYDIDIEADDINVTDTATIGSKVSPVQSTSKVPRMSFKCFSLAMSIISIKSFVEENRIIKKQNAILKKLQEVFGQVGILLK